MNSAILCSQTGVIHHRRKALVDFGNFVNYTRNMKFWFPPFYLNSTILAMKHFGTLSHSWLSYSLSPFSLKTILLTIEQMRRANYIAKNQRPVKKIGECSYISGFFFPYISPVSFPFLPCSTWSVRVVIDGHCSDSPSPTSVPSLH